MIPAFRRVLAPAALALLLAGPAAGATLLLTGTPGAAVFSESEAQSWFDIGLYAYPWFADMDGDLDIDLPSGRDQLGFVYYRKVSAAFAAAWTSSHMRSTPPRISIRGGRCERIRRSVDGHVGGLSL